MIRLALIKGRKNYHGFHQKSLKWLMSNFLLFTERNLSTTSSTVILSIRVEDEDINAKLFNLLCVILERRLELSLFRREKLRSASLLVMGNVRIILRSFFKDGRQCISE